jgi:hypothetical protein
MSRNVFFVLLWVFKPARQRFRPRWFVESLTSICRALRSERVTGCSLILALTSLPGNTGAAYFLVALPSE